MIKNMVKALVGSSLSAKIGWLKRNGTSHYAIHRYEEIDGWLSLNEAIALYDIAKSLPGDSPVVVEIGVWQGRSVFVIAQSFRKKPGAKIFCVDPFNADSSPEEREFYRSRSEKFDEPLERRFLDICDSYGIRPFVEVLAGYSYDFSPSWIRPIDFLYIDAGHAYEAVTRDYLEWSGFVREGGYILFHDVNFEERSGGWKSGPGASVRRHLLNDDRFVIHKYVDSLFVAKRVSGDSHTPPPPLFDRSHPPLDDPLR